MARKSNLKRRDFLALADNIGLSRKAADRLIDSVLKRKEKTKEMCRDSALNEDLQNAMIEMIETRCNKLK